MKKKMRKIKKAVSVCMLSTMVVCAVAPPVQAYNNIIKSGSRGGGAASGYYSKTTVTAFDGNGVAEEAIAGARMPDTPWTYVSGTPTATAISARSSIAGSTYHAYGVNGVIYGTWIEN